MRNRNFELPEERIGITAGAPGEMIVRFTYTEDRVERIRTIAGRRWDRETKSWIVPRGRACLDALFSVFEADRVWVEPRLLDSLPKGIKVERVLDMTWVLSQMAQELRLRGYRAKTRKAYIGHAERFFRAVNKEFGEIEDGEVRGYVHNLLECGSSHSYANQCVSALKFLFVKVLKRPEPIQTLPRPKKEHKLPRILSRSEVARILEAVKNPKHRAIMMLTYSAGLRLGEVVRLRVEDIDAERQLIHVRQGKGRKDRYTVLSEFALEALRTYVRKYRPEPGCFQASAPGGTCTNDPYRKSSTGLTSGQELRSQCPSTRSDTHLRPISWKGARTFDTFKSFWATRVQKRQRSIRT